MDIDLELGFDELKIKKISGNKYLIEAAAKKDVFTTIVNKFEPVEIKNFALKISFGVNE